MADPATDACPLERFELDIQADRQVSVLRGVAVALLLLCGLWLLALPYAVPRMVALAGLAFAVLWVARARQQRIRAKHPELHFLELWPDRLVVGEPPPSGRELPWAEIAGIELDEDALVVKLHTADGDCVVIEPKYRGIGLGDLYGTIAESWQAARAGCAPAADG